MTDVNIRCRSVIGLVLAAGCAWSSNAIAQQPHRRPRVQTINSVTPIYPEYIVYKGVRYPVIPPVADSSGIVYSNRSGTINTVTGGLGNALDDFSFSPGPASGVPVLLTQVVTGFLLQSLPAGGAFDLALGFYDNMTPANSPVNTTPIGGAYPTYTAHFAGLTAGGGYIGTIPLAGLPGGGIQIPDDTSNGMVWNLYSTGTQTPLPGGTYFVAEGSSTPPGAGPSVGGSSAGFWSGADGTTGSFASSDGPLIVGTYTAGSNLYLEFTGTYTPTALGGCCLNTGSCTPNQTSAQCTTLGGLWLGANVACGNCPARGACCTSAGTCTTMMQALCVGVAGVYSGDNITCPPTPACSTQYFEDNGVYAVGNGPGSATGSVVWMNQFTVANGLSTINSIDIVFADIAAGNLNNLPITVYLWSDGTTSGNPVGATVLASAPGVIANSGTQTFNSFPIPPTNVGPNGTKFFVGAILNNATPPQPGLYPAAEDTATIQGKSWTLNNSTGAVIVPTALTGIAVVGGNFLVRADATGSGPTCYPNCDLSTNPPILNVQDFSCFLQKFASGNLYANCDASTNPPVLNVQDFSCFLQKYATGCT